MENVEFSRVLSLSAEARFDMRFDNHFDILELFQSAEQTRMRRTERKFGVNRALLDGAVWQIAILKLAIRGSRAMTTKVTMNLSDRDIANTDTLVALTHSRSKAQAVSTALSVTKLLAQRMKVGSEVLIRSKDGKLETLVIPELADE